MTLRLAAITWFALLGLMSTHAQQPTGRQFQLVGDGKAYRLEMKSVARPDDGRIALIGGLSGFASDVPAGRLLRMGARVTGIYVGSRADFEAMNGFMSQHKIRPTIDRVFPFEQAPQAFELMDNGSYLGKIVIKL